MMFFYQLKDSTTVFWMFYGCSSCLPTFWPAFDCPPLSTCPSQSLVKCPPCLAFCEQEVMAAVMAVGSTVFPQQRRGVFVCTSQIITSAFASCLLWKPAAIEWHKPKLHLTATAVCCVLLFLNFDARLLLPLLCRSHFLVLIGRWSRGICVTLTCWAPHRRSTRVDVAPMDLIIFAHTGDAHWWASGWNCADNSRVLSQEAPICQWEEFPVWMLPEAQGDLYTGRDWLWQE